MIITHKRNVSPHTRRAMTALVLFAALLVACQGRTGTVAGEWNGVLRVGDKTTHSVMHIHSDDTGKLTASIDAIDEQLTGVQLADVALKGNDFSFRLPAVNGSYRGQLSADGTTINGIWTKPPQAPSPLVFTRQAPASDDANDD
jgi:hypothetical protein